MLIGDMPIYEAIRQGSSGQASGPDKLKFERTAQVLADAAVESHQPINIGVYGKWGTGKTSLMRLMMEKVRDPERVTPAIPAWFNAWQYERDEHLIVPLIATINREIEREIAQMEKSLPALEKAKRDVKQALVTGAKKLHAALRSVAYGFAIRGKVGIPMMAEADVNLSGKDMVNRYQELTKDSVLARSLYFDAFEELRKLSDGKEIPRPRIVVFVDDLDRCFPDKAVELLEGIKLVLHQPGFCFVLGVNDGIIREYVRTKYTKDYNIDIEKVDFNYLEKIVQVEVRVPERAPDAMTDYIESLLSDAGMLEEFCPQGGRQVDRDVLFAAVAIAGRQNPREIVRRLNKLILAWRLQEADEFQLLDLLLNDIIPPQLKSRLDSPVGSEDTPMTLAELILAIVVKADQHATAEDFVEHLKREVLSNKSITAAYIDKIPDHELPSLAMLRTLPGKRWLGDKNLRSGLAKIVVEATETQPSSVVPQESELVQRAIREIERDMVDIPGGDFMMGEDESSVEVRLSAFKMSKYQVTQDVYEAITGKNPSKFKGPRMPVESVSWSDAEVFCGRLSSLTGRIWRLPTEAQWEYACRAGSQTAYCFGDDGAKLEEYAWFEKNSGQSTHPVGGKKPNKFGLYDVHGNVWEWCADWHGSSLPGGTDPTGPSSGSYRVARGGSWFGNAQNCRSANRFIIVPSFRISYFGFRVLSPVQ